jgi:MFS family permease
MYVLSYACIKGFVYGLFFWLPTILNEKGGEIAAQRGYINAMFDIGSIAGSLFEGFLADRYQRRALYLSPSLFLTAVVTFLLSFALN